jgi:hypothetical protein
MAGLPIHRSVMLMYELVASAGTLRYNTHLAHPLKPIWAALIARY